MAVYLKKGNWYVDFWVQGRRRREKVGPSKKQALQVLNKRLIQVAENKFFDIKKDEKITFSDFAPIYMELYAKPNKKSWAQADNNILNRLLPPFGKKYLYEITPLMIERYKEERLKTVCKATINRELACMKVMYSKAVEWGKAAENPVKKVKLFRDNNQRVRFLTKDEIQTLLDNCSPKLRAIVEVALNTGMRKGEIQRLRWDDVDYLNEVITLNETKNGEKRYIPLNPNVRRAFNAIPRHPKSSLIFCNKRGQRFNFRKAFSTALINSKIVDFRFHDLRHTFASHLAMSGVDLNTIRELLGHKTLDMTLRYSHLSQSHKSKAVAILGLSLDTQQTPAPSKDSSEKTEASATPSSTTV